MERLRCAPRHGWREQVEALGLVWHSTDTQPYWDESAYYSFSADEIEAIERATAELHTMFIAAGDHVIDRGLLGQFAIPEICHEAIRHEWATEPPALNYGRFDLGVDSHGAIKLFEFNCDTPTSLLEAAVIQWDWKEAEFPRNDQFNSIHDKLVAKWRSIAPPAGTSMLHLTHAGDPSGEDAVTVAYMADTARTAGIDTQILEISSIGWDRESRRFVDTANRAIDCLYHLYPWEWLVREAFAPQIIESLPVTVWIDPIWKMMWSNKAILAVLWELFPDSPYLLETSREPLRGDQVVKPLLAREGANVTIIRDGAEVAATGGNYGAEGLVYQRLFDLPGSGDQRPVIGSWVVDGEPAGIGIREDGPITGNTARFIPHIIGD